MYVTVWLREAPLTNDPDRPFGHDNLKLRAVFVPEGNPDDVSETDITEHVGQDVVKIPAVFIPEGSDIAPPGYPYVHVGQYQMSESGELGAQEPAQGDGDGGRGGGQGSESSDSTQPGRMPPVPALARGGGGSMAAGLAVLRGTRNPAAVWRNAGKGAAPPVPPSADASAASQPPAKQEGQSAPRGGTASPTIPPVAAPSPAATAGRGVRTTVRRMLRDSGNGEGAGD